MMIPTLSLRIKLLWYRWEMEGSTFVDASNATGLHFPLIRAVVKHVLNRIKVEYNIGANMWKVQINSTHNSSWNPLSDMYELVSDRNTITMQPKGILLNWQ